MSLFESCITKSLHFVENNGLVTPLTDEAKGNGNVCRQRKCALTARRGIASRVQGGGPAADRKRELWAFPPNCSLLTPSTHKAQYKNSGAGKANLKIVSERCATKSNVDADARKQLIDAAIRRTRVYKPFEAKVPATGLGKNSLRRVKTAPKEIKATRTSETSVTSKYDDVTAPNGSKGTSVLATKANDKKVKRVTFAESSTRVKRTIGKSAWHGAMAITAASAGKNEQKVALAAVKLRRSCTVKGRLESNKDMAKQLDKGGSYVKLMDIITNAGPASKEKKVEKASGLKGMPTSSLRSNPKHVKPTNKAPLKSATVKTKTRGEFKSVKTLAQLLGTQPPEEKKAAPQLVKKTGKVDQRIRAGAVKMAATLNATKSKPLSKSTPPACKNVGQSVDEPQTACKSPAKRATAGSAAQPTGSSAQKCCISAKTPAKPKQVGNTKPKAINTGNKCTPAPPAPVRARPIRKLSCTFELQGLVNRPDFRQELQSHAIEQNLCGSVTLTPHNTYRGVLQGREKDINCMKAWLMEQGPDDTYTAKFTELRRVFKSKTKGFRIRPSTRLDERVELDEPWLWLDPDRNKRTIKRARKTRGKK